MTDCLFCKIINGTVKSYKIYEDKLHIGILDIFPAVEGQSLILPKTHFGSYAFAMNDHEYLSLMSACRNLAKLIDRRLGSLRTCMVMEGMEIDHAHIKLYPIYRIGREVAKGSVDLNVYPGYISTKHGKRMQDSKLQVIASKFK